MPMKPISATLGPVATDLGLGDMLADQVAGETEEERKKRMQQQQQQRQMGPAGNMAVTNALFGGMGALGR